MVNNKKPKPEPSPIIKPTHQIALEMRKAIGRVNLLTAQWCNAFDQGDVASLEKLAPLLEKAMLYVAISVQEMKRAIGR